MTSDLHSATFIVREIWRSCWNHMGESSVKKKLKKEKSLPRSNRVLLLVVRLYGCMGSFLAVTLITVTLIDVLLWQLWRCLRLNIVKYSFVSWANAKKLPEEISEVIQRMNARVLNDSPTIIGAEQFSQFTLLNDKVRDAGDEEQQNTLTSLRSFYGNQVSHKLL